METIRFSLAEDQTAQSITSGLQERFPIIADQAATESLLFFDTFDWRLFNRSQLLYRSDDEYILRCLKDNLVLQRQPVEAMPKFVWEFPDGPLKRELEPVIEMRALIKLAEAELQTESYRILNEDEKTVVRLAYTRLESRQGTGGGDTGGQLTLRPVRGYEQEGQAVSQYLAAMGLAPDPENIYLTAMTAGSRPPGDYTSKLNFELEPDMRADEAAKIILRFLLAVMQANEAGIKEDIDTEFLHDFRVAVRRTRSALSQIGEVFPEATTSRFREDFAAIGQFTNDLRDLDVYLLAEDDYKAMLPEGLRPDIEPLFDYLRQKRSGALQQVVQGLNGPDYSRILAEWAAFLDEPANADSAAGPNGARPAIQLARNRIYKRYRRVVKWGRNILENMADEQLHALRLECKKLRYLMEFFESLFPEEQISTAIKQVKKLQTNLGDFNDLSVQEHYLQSTVDELALAGVEAKKVFLAVGYLISVLEQKRLQVKAEFAQTFTDFATPANKKLFKQLFATGK